MPAMNYVSFAWHNRRLLGFGFLMTFYASFGQTFFIGIYGAEIRSAFDLSHGQYGAIYSAATLTSALILLWAGRRIDRVDLRQFASIVCGGLALSMVLLGSALGAITLFAALFALRLTGQGLIVHTAATSMARYFDTARGRAISIAFLGIAAGEAVLPASAVILTGAIGWRASWWFLAGLTAISLIPLVRHLLKDHAIRDTKSGDVTPDQSLDGAGWPLPKVLHDPRFWAIISAASAPAFMITGLFFHHAHLAAAKGWSLAWLATAFIAYAAATAPSSLLSGVLVDRWQANRMVPFMLLPLAAALTVVALWDHPMVAVIYLTLAGIGSGITSPINGSLLAELYGTTHLGAIRSVQTALMVLASALSPVVLGWLIDNGTSMESIALAFVAYILAASVILGWVFTRPKRAVLGQNN